MNCDGCCDVGMCCRYVELPLARPLIPDERRWVELHEGLRMKGARTLRIDLACSALTPDGTCAVYGSEARPELCAIWPDDPLNQAPEGCKFKEPVKAQGKE